GAAHGLPGGEHLLPQLPIAAKQLGGPAGHLPRGALVPGKIADLLLLLRCQRLVRLPAVVEVLGLRANALLHDTQQSELGKGPQERLVDAATPAAAAPAAFRVVLWIGVERLRPLPHDPGGPGP